MKSAQLSVKTIYKSTFQTIKSHPLFLLAISLIVWLIQFPFNYLNGFIDNPILSPILSLISWFIVSVVTLGLTNTVFNLVDTNTRKYPYLYNKTNLVLQYIIASTLFGIIITFGFILLIIPGIIWAIQFQFYPYLIIDKSLNFKQALKQSKGLTVGYKKKLFLLGITILLLNLLGLLAFGYGVIITLPISIIILSHTYRFLNPKIDIPQDKIKPTPSESIPPESEVFVENPEEIINPEHIVDEPPPIISPDKIK